MASLSLSWFWIQSRSGYRFQIRKTEQRSRCQVKMGPISWSKHNKYKNNATVRQNVPKSSFKIFFTLDLDRFYLTESSSCHICCTCMDVPVIQYTIYQNRHIKSVLWNRDDMLRFRFRKSFSSVPNNCTKPCLFNFHRQKQKESWPLIFDFFTSLLHFMLDPDPNPVPDPIPESGTVMHSGSAKRQKVTVPAIPVPAPHHCKKCCIQGVLQTELYTKRKFVKKIQMGRWH